MAGFTSIRAKIKAKLDTISELAFVFDHHRDVVDGFPVAIFDIIESDNEFLTNAENLRQYTFAIMVYAETETKSVKEATDILDTVSDSIVTAFESDVTLGGEVDWCLALTGTRDEFDTPQGSAIGQELIISCNVAVAV